MLPHVCSALGSTRQMPCPEGITYKLEVDQPRQVAGLAFSPRVLAFAIRRRPWQDGAMSDINTEKPTRKTSSVRHTRAIQRDRTKRAPTALPHEQVAARLTEIVHPATLAQVAYFHDLGLRERVLTLPVMVALVLSMIWQQVSGVSELVRLVSDNMLLWVPPMKIKQQALAERLRTLPSDLFLRVLLAILPSLHARWGARQRPLLPEVAWAQAHYSQVAIVDGSTLDALLRKVGLDIRVRTYATPWSIPWRDG